MTTTHDALATALHRVAPDINLEEIGDDELFVEVAELDSMDFLNLLTVLHELIGIDVPERDYAAFTTVTAIERYLDEHRPVDTSAESGSS